MTPRKKFISYFIWIFFAFSIGIGISYLTIKSGTFAYGMIYSQNSSTKIPISSQEALVPTNIIKKALIELPPPLKNVSIGFVGDIIPGTNAPENIFSEIMLYAEKPDIMIGNFEGAVTQNIYKKCKSDSTNCFSFNGDNNFLKLLSEASFDVLNIANNHFNDYGEKEQEETLKEMERAGIIASGIKNKITYLTRNNLTVGIIGFSTYLWTTDMNNAKALKKIISEANQNADIVVVIFHGGGEGEKYTHTPVGTEKYLGENRGNLREFSHSSIDAGADIVLGSGPHVLRGIERYNDKLIAYSLGNFTYTNALSTSSYLKTSAMIEVTLEKDGTFVSGVIYPFEIDDYGIPHPDLNSTAISTINNLSKNDFRQDGVILDSLGTINLE